MPERTVQLLSVVVPVHNDEPALGPFWEQISKALAGVPFELMLVDDGSDDDSARSLGKLAATDNRVKLVVLARRHGRSTAIRAGVDHARGNVIAVFQRGLRDLPAPLPTLLERWRSGEDQPGAGQLLLAGPEAWGALPSPARRRLTHARQAAFIAASIALLAAITLVVVQLARSRWHYAAVIESTVLIVGAAQLAFIAVAIENLPSSDDNARYSVRERRNILPPPEPLSELEELVSDLDLER